MKVRLLGSLKAKFGKEFAIYARAALARRDARRWKLLVISFLEAVSKARRAQPVVIMTHLREQQLSRTYGKYIQYQAYIDTVFHIHIVCLSKGIACITLQSTDRKKKPLESEEVEKELLAFKQPTCVFSYHTIQEGAFSRLRDAGHAVVHFKPGDIVNSVTLDYEGFAGWASIASITQDCVRQVSLGQNMLQNFFTETSQNVISKNVSKYGQPDLMKTCFSEPYVFVALQTANDIVQKNAYVPMLEMLDWVVYRFYNSNYKVVVKRHPLCIDETIAATVDRLEQDYDHVIVSDISIHFLLSGAEAVFTVNSGVGSEAMYHAKPIYCFGRSDYAFVAHQIKSYEDLIDTTSPIHFKVSEDDFLKFFYIYRTEYQLSGAHRIRQRIDSVLNDKGKKVAGLS